MSNTCEIISPSRSSKVIRTNGLIPFLEGANDTILEVIEPRSPRSKSPLRNREGDPEDGVIKEDPKGNAPQGGAANIRPNFSYFDFNFSQFNNPKYRPSYNENRSGTPPRNKTPPRHISWGIDQSVHESSLFSNFSNADDAISEETYHEKERVFKSPANLDALDEMYKLDQVTIEVYSNPSAISRNGCIEPLKIKEISTFEFIENSFKASLSLNDVRRRSFLIKETINYNAKSIEFFEDNVDIFAPVNKSTIRNKFVESFNQEINQFSVSAIAGMTHNNKVLDMSWVSDDNSQVDPYQQKSQTISDEIAESDYININNNDIIEYYETNSITVSNEYPKIFEVKHSTGYTYDRSKVQGLDSIAFSGIME